MPLQQVEEYLNARVYGPDSAAYQLFELPHHFQSHSCFVMKLSFPGRETVRFNPAHDERRVLETATARQQLNHTQQYLSMNAQEARMLFHATELELAALIHFNMGTFAHNGGDSCRFVAVFLIRQLFLNYFLLH